MIDKIKCHKCTVIEYNLFEKCIDRTCLKKATSYGIRSVLTIMVDGKISVRGKPTETRLRHYIVL
jgi:predicted DsbA family dithiol-disulfide isomerase